MGISPSGSGSSWRVLGSGGSLGAFVLVELDGADEEVGVVEGVFAGSLAGGIVGDFAATVENLGVSTVRLRGSAGPFPENCVSLEKLKEVGLEDGGASCFVGLLLFVSFPLGGGCLLVFVGLFLSVFVVVSFPVVMLLVVVSTCFKESSSFRARLLALLRIVSGLPKDAPVSISSGSSMITVSVFIADGLEEVFLDLSVAPFLFWVGVAPFSRIRLSWLERAMISFFFFGGDECNPSRMDGKASAERSFLERVEDDIDMSVFKV